METALWGLGCDTQVASAAPFFCPARSLQLEDGAQQQAVHPGSWPDSSYHCAMLGKTRPGSGHFWEVAAGVPPFLAGFLVTPTEAAPGQGVVVSAVRRSLQRRQ